MNEHDRNLLLLLIDDIAKEVAHLRAFVVAAYEPDPEPKNKK